MYKDEIKLFAKKCKKKKKKRIENPNADSEIIQSGHWGGICYRKC